MLIFIKGAGDLASGIALRLFHAGFEIVMTEIAAPLAVRRTVSFSQAVYDGTAKVEDVCATLAKTKDEIQNILEKKQIAIMVDPAAAAAAQLKPLALIDAIMAKKNTGTSINDAPIVIGIGPGFCAGLDCHAVVETKRGHTLGRVITEGSALPNTGIPGEIGGATVERLLRAEAAGIFGVKTKIGNTVKKGDIVAEVIFANGGAVPVCAKIDGMVRGLLPAGIAVTKGIKAGDIDPRCEKIHCFTVSDKALAVGGGVLEAIMRFMAHNKSSFFAAS
jgi:xanthine dehydrogenase accessory factor